ncbi:unnamed protein product [Linum trigynum]|uniref:Secreted protein n=1 Tax=Linum trigynum TaxID=586398 RepID=A0AAV2F529_9ROSI
MLCCWIKIASLFWTLARLGSQLLIMLSMIDRIALSYTYVAKHSVFSMQPFLPTDHLKLQTKTTFTYLVDIKAVQILFLPLFRVVDFRRSLNSLALFPIPLNRLWLLSQNVRSGLVPYHPHGSQLISSFLVFTNGDIFEHFIHP